MKHFFSFLVAVVVLSAGSSIPAATLFVNVNNLNPVPPYTNWSTAATNIQDAIDVSSNGDLVLVSNGVYQTGGRLASDSTTNRVVIDKAITLQSVNGPSVTMIEGNSVLNSNAVRCVYMTNTSVLSGFTLTNGGALTSGGGVWTTNSGAIISNCVLIGNSAALLGGGAYNGSIYNCSIIQNSAGDGGGVAYLGSFTNTPVVKNSLIAGNSATGYGGGAWDATLKNCRVLQNTAAYGGGVESSSLYGCLVASNTASQMGGGIDDGISTENCTIVGNTGGEIFAGSIIYNSIIYYNTDINGSSANYDGGSTLVNCCTTPLPQNNVNSITNAPGFVDYTSGDFHLASNSPCINGGNNSVAYNKLGTDLDGNPRIVDGLVDIGAYEYQTPGSRLPYYWAQQYGLSVDDGTIIDPYADGMNYWWVAVTGSNPTNAASVLKLSVSNSVSGIVVTWPESANKAYDLQRSTNLLADPAFVPIYTNVVFAFPRTWSFRDASATNSGSYFYRVGVLY